MLNSNPNDVGDDAATAAAAAAAAAAAPAAPTPAALHIQITQLSSYFLISTLECNLGRIFHVVSQCHRQNRSFHYDWKLTEKRENQYGPFSLLIHVFKR